MSVFVRDVVFWNPDTEALDRGDLLVGDGAVTPTTEPPAPHQTLVDGRGRLALPGLINGHHHIYSALARGMPFVGPAPRNFAEILKFVWWKLDRCLDHDMIRASAYAAAMDSLRCGVTTIVDHHASPMAVDGCLDVIAEAFDHVGVSHLLCYEMSDRDGAHVARAGLAESERYLASGRPALVGLHASFTVGSELLDGAVDLARSHGVGLHLHVAEDPVDQHHCLADHGCRVVERLHAAGVLEQPGTILGHGLHLDADERELVTASGAWVVQNTESNQNNAVGRFSPTGLDADRILVGTDGMHGDMLRSVRAAYLDGQREGLAPADAWRRLWRNRRYLQAHHPTALRGDDLVLLDYQPPTPMTDENFAAHAMFGLDARHTSTVVAAGRVLLDQGRITSVDEPAILAECHEQARRLWSALKGQP